MIAVVLASALAGPAAPRGARPRGLLTAMEEIAAWVDEAPPEPPARDPSVGPRATLGYFDNALGASALGRSRYASPALRTGSSPLRPTLDTLLHLRSGASCELTLDTSGDACAAEVRCDGITLYASDAAHGLRCAPEADGVADVAMVVTDTSPARVDGTPIFLASSRAVQLSDDGPKGGVLHFARQTTPDVL